MTQVVNFRRGGMCPAEIGRQLRIDPRTVISLLKERGVT